MIDTAKIKKSHDLMPLIPVELHRKASTGGGELEGPCPFCGGTDRFHVQPNSPEGQRWFCSHCTERKWKDIIAYIMLRDGKNFLEACEYLGGESIDRADFKPAEHHRPKIVPPPAKWQMRAFGLIDELERGLWAPGGRRALEWLKKRGLCDETIRRARIGFNPSDLRETLEQWGLPEEADDNGKPRVVHLPRGIVIPGIFRRLPFYLKIRRPHGEPKYIHVKGSKPALYLADSLTDLKPAVLAEGELDALLLLQETLAKLGVVTLGSAYNGLALWAGQLRATHPLLVAYHNDEAGTMNSAKINRNLPEARLVEIPKLRPGDKDLTDFYCSGGNLREWIEKIHNDKR